jgi:hypothetical protein
MDQYFPEGDESSIFTVYGCATAQTLVQVLKQCGDDLTRENVVKQAANLKHFELGVLLPGITVNTVQPTIIRSSKSSYRGSMATTASCLASRSPAKSVRNNGRRLRRPL